MMLDCWEWSVPDQGDGQHVLGNKWLFRNLKKKKKI